MSANIDRWLGDVHEGDCLALLKALPDCSVETCITDPPAGISFMGKSWDGDKGGRREWVAWLAAVLAECLRVTKPGGTLVCWAIPRTSHWTGMAIEDAGWYPVDVITHHFGSGFPKSHDISAALDRRAGMEREVVGEYESYRPNTDAHACTIYNGETHTSGKRTAPASALAREWDGWGTALKPATEFWWLARKPCEGSFAANAEAHGVAGLWVDGARVGTGDNTQRNNRGERFTGQGGCGRLVWADSPALGKVACLDKQAGALQPGMDAAVAARAHARGGLGLHYANGGVYEPEGGAWQSGGHAAGRWPPNAVFSHAPGCRRVGEQRVGGASRARIERTGDSTISKHGGLGIEGGRPVGFATPGYADADGLETVEAWECVDGCPVAELARQSGESRSIVRVSEDHDEQAATYALGRTGVTPRGHADRGTAARFFPQFPADEDEPGFLYCPKAARKEREAGCEGLVTERKPRLEGDTRPCHGGEQTRVANHHPTVKPLALMRWLCRLTRTPRGGTVLDPFAGSGTTLIAAMLEGRDFIGFEQAPEYVAIARARLAHHRRAMTPQLPLEAAAGGGE